MGTSRSIAREIITFCGFERPRIYCYSGMAGTVSLGYIGSSPTNVPSARSQVTMVVGALLLESVNACISTSQARSKPNWRLMSEMPNALVLRQSLWPSLPGWQDVALYSSE